MSHTRSHARCNLRAPSRRATTRHVLFHPLFDPMMRKEAAVGKNLAQVFNTWADDLDTTLIHYLLQLQPCLGWCVLLCCAVDTLCADFCA